MLEQPDGLGDRHQLVEEVGRERDQIRGRGGRDLRAGRGLRPGLHDALIGVDPVLVQAVGLRVFKHLFSL